MRQSAYRILVASSPELLRKDKGDLWDSGKVDSSQSNQVVYDGEKLQSRDLCFWKVKVWTNNGSESDWSASANWSMGLLEPQDWNAQWISIDSSKLEKDTKSDGDLDSRNSPMLRKAFDISKPVEQAQLSICGLGYYELSLNGSKVGDHVLDPTWTCYHKDALYVTYDLSEKLQKDENAIGVQLANGVYNQSHRDAWNFHKAPWRAFPQMLLQLDIVYADGSRERIVSDESWKASTGPVRRDQLRMGVFYDARREQPEWTTADFDDSDWMSAVEREGIEGKLAAQMSEPSKVMKTLEAVDIKKEGKNSYIFDFGQNIAGWVRLKVSGPTGTKVVMDYGGPDQHVPDKPFQTDNYTLKGDGEEIWEPRFTYHGFDTVKVTGLPEPPQEDTLKARVVYTAFDERGAFECSNPLLNDITTMTRWAYIGNFVGIPTDCPHREKNGWSGDAHIAAELGLLYYGSEAAYTRWMLDFQSIQRKDGKLPSIVSTGGWGVRPP